MQDFASSANENGGHSQQFAQIGDAARPRSLHQRAQRRKWNLLRRRRANRFLALSPRGGIEARVLRHVRGPVLPAARCAPATRTLARKARRSPRLRTRSAEEVNVLPRRMFG